ncbi:L,D-carboxypeptidase A [compost metagenome]
MIDRLRSSLKKVQVIAGLPFGHVQTKVLLPVGAKVALAAEGRDVFLVWGHRHGHHDHDHHGHDHHGHDH